MKNHTKIAYFGAGCFWNVEEAFRKTKGVKKTTVGFMGGDVENPSYELVCGGGTGHAETTKVEYDPEKITYDDLLNIFWGIHDPTTLNRQGPDIGDQYRSVIFYVNENQKEKAIKSKEIQEKSGKFKNEIVTDIVPATNFYKAEEYHQKYLKKQRNG